MQITKGFDFNSTGICDNTSLHALIDAATFSNADLSDFSSSQKPIYISGTEPSNPVLGQLFYSNTIHGSSNPTGILLAYDGIRFSPVACGIYGRILSTSVVVGDVCAFVIDSGELNMPRFARTSATSNNRCFAIAASNLAVSEKGFFITRGMAFVNLNAGAIVGGAIKSSTTSGFASASSLAVTAGCFGRVLDVTNSLCLLTGPMKAV